MKDEKALDSCLPNPNGIAAFSQGGESSKLPWDDLAS